MMFERFTSSARTVVRRAYEEAHDLRHNVIGTEHLLLALLDDDAGMAFRLLHDAGIDQRRVRAEVVRLGTPAPKILNEEDAAALRTVGIDVDAVLARIEESFGPDALQAPAPPSRRGLLGRARSVRTGLSPRARGVRTGLSPNAKKVLELALREAIRLGYNSIGTEHLLLAILREREGLAARILINAGLDLDTFRDRIVAGLRRAA